MVFVILAFLAFLFAETLKAQTNAPANCGIYGIVESGCYDEYNALVVIGNYPTAKTRLKVINQTGNPVELEAHTNYMSATGSSTSVWATFDNGGTVSDPQIILPMVAYTRWVDLIGVGGTSAPAPGPFIGSADVYVQAYGTVGDPALPALLDQFAVLQDACEIAGDAPLQAVIMNNGQPTAVFKLMRVRDIAAGADVSVQMNIADPSSPLPSPAGTVRREIQTKPPVAGVGNPQQTSFVVKNVGLAPDTVTTWLSTDDGNNPVCTGPTLSIGADALQTGQVVGDLFPAACFARVARSYSVHFTPSPTGTFLSALIAGSGNSQ